MISRHFLGEGTHGIGASDVAGHTTAFLHGGHDLGDRLALFLVALLCTHIPKTSSYINRPKTSRQAGVAVLGEYEPIQKPSSLTGSRFLTVSLACRGWYEVMAQGTGGHQLTCRPSKHYRAVSPYLIEAGKSGQKRYFHGAAELLELRGGRGVHHQQRLHRSRVSGPHHTYGDKK